MDNVWLRIKGPEMHYCTPSAPQLKHDEKNSILRKYVCQLLYPCFVHIWRDATFWYNSSVFWCCRASGLSLCPEPCEDTVYKPLHRRDREGFLWLKVKKITESVRRQGCPVLRERLEHTVPKAWRRLRVACRSEEIASVWQAEAVLGFFRDEKGEDSGSYHTRLTVPQFFFLSNHAPESEMDDERRALRTVLADRSEKKKYQFRNWVGTQISVDMQDKERRGGKRFTNEKKVANTGWSHGHRKQYRDTYMKIRSTIMVSWEQIIVHAFTLEKYEYRHSKVLARGQNTRKPRRNHGSFNEPLKSQGRLPFCSISSWIL